MTQRNDSMTTQHDNADWRDHAHCIGFDPELFFPIGRSDKAQQQTARAKLVCRDCAVARECLEFAQRERIGDGVFGGLDASERNKLRSTRLIRAQRQ